MDEILDDFIDFKSPRAKYNWNYIRRWYLIVSGIIANTICLTILYCEADFVRYFADKLSTLSYIVLIGGFASGLIISLFPFKELSYKAKYLHSSQWAMAAILIIFAIMVLISAIRAD